MCLTLINAASETIQMSVNLQKINENHINLKELMQAQLLCVYTSSQQDLKILITTFLLT